MTESACRNESLLIYIGLALVTLATTMFEILLTRIFSVLVWYHLTFVIVSLAMFGLTFGAIIVFFAQYRLKQFRLGTLLSFSALAFAIGIALSFRLMIFLGYRMQLDAAFLLLVLSMIAVPFTCSGIAVCLALTRCDLDIGKLYAADLTGAALGCLALVPLLGPLDAPSAVFLVAAVAAGGAAAFAFAAGNRFGRVASLVSMLALAGLCAANVYMSDRHQPLFAVTARFRKVPLLYDKWNCFSWVQLNYSGPNHRPLAWGLSPRWPDARVVDEVTLTIDNLATTVLTKYSGDPAQIEHLRWDVTGAADFLRPNADVLVVGLGGGRDVLTALAFHEKSVTGVELNGNIVDLLRRGVFADFTGHLDRLPGVTFVNDEARSYIAGSARKFGIIQISLIDTSAASAAGALVLSEHSLYTVEAWKSFLDHLSAGGVLSVTRWYSPDRPPEQYRVISLAAKVLHDRGIADLRRHVIVLGLEHGGYGGRNYAGIATTLVSPTPFSDDDLMRINQFAASRGFEVILSAKQSSDANMAALLNGQQEQVAASTGFNLSPPTDDSPFFFFMLPPKDVLNVMGNSAYLNNSVSCLESTRKWLSQSVINVTFAMAMLGYLTVAVVVLAVLCVCVPPLFVRARVPAAQKACLLVYFAGIGLGFMFIEVSQMQRLIIFLGHPVYSLSVVLFTLLLAGGAGSLTVNSLALSQARASSLARLCCLLAVLACFGLLVGPLSSAFAGACTFVRVLLACALLAPAGLFMGMAFPLGMLWAKQSAEPLTPWLWSVNGAMSVCASVAVMTVSLLFGLSAAFWTGFACYALAFLAYAGGALRTGKS